jgi:tRNA nucleotidyltransferase (CCA-adding enzyme)
MIEDRAIEGRWEHFPHGADIGIRGIGLTKEMAFEQAAMALTAVITDPSQLAARTEVHVSCEAPDDELLLVDWLNALVYEMATRRMLFGRFHVTITGNHLRGRAWGETVEPHRHEPAVEVKGATLTELRVTRDPASDEWIAQCVVDV